MADPITLTNITFLENELAQEIIAEIGTLISVFYAIGGMLALWILFTIWKIVSSKKQQNVLNEIKEDIKKIKRKLKIK